MLGVLNTKNIKEGGASATRSREKRVLRAWRFKQKKHRGKGVGATHNKKQKVLRLEF